MNYCFDELVERRGTNCIKYDFNARNGKPENVIPLWVADMDFACPPAVTQALQKICSQRIYGYSDLSDSYWEAVHQWYLSRFGWDTKREWLCTTPGVVHALATAVLGFTQPGDSVLIQPPVYPPFADTVIGNGRTLVENRLVYENERYTIDFEDFEEKIAAHQVKVFLLCSPHNPVGRVWTKEELLKMDEICRRHQVIVVSDEIHSDFVYAGHRHWMFAQLNEEAAQNCVVCTSTSKTFNVAGLQHSNIFIPNPELRQKFHQQLHATHTDGANLFGPAACQAAYEEGGPWLDQLLLYLKENETYIRNFLKENIPQITMPELEGTYLLWMDCRKLPVPAEELEHFLTEKAGLWLNDGSMFGDTGKGFQRVNIACPRAQLQRAMEQLKRAVDELFQNNG